MRSIFALAITFFLLTACSHTPTVEPTSISLSIPTGTPEPSATPAATYTPTPEIVKFDAQTWAGTDVARTSFLEAGGQIDSENGVAWNPENGRVYYAKDAKGEWMSYPDGNVPIPPGPGYENEPPLLVPYYHSFTEAMNAVTNDLPWGAIPNVYREKQNNEIKRVGEIYWKPFFDNGEWSWLFSEGINIHVTTDPSETANVRILGMKSSEGLERVRLHYESQAEDNYFVPIFVFGDPKLIYEELTRIDNCYLKNRKAPNLAELCKSNILQIAAPAK